MNRILEIGLSNAVVATGLALLAALVGRLVRRPALAHVLWLLVLLKLVTPAFWAVPVSWPQAFAPPARTPDPDLVAPSPAVSQEAAPQGEDIASLREWEAVSDISEADATNRREVEPTQTSWETAKASLAGIPWISVIAAGWLAGAVVVLAIAGWRVACFHRLLRFGRRAPASLQEEAHQLARQLGLAWCPQLWIVPGSVAPLVWAVGGAARLVLPSHLLERLGRQQRETLLAHELAHVLRRDHWVRWLELVVTALYWWHPAAWWARREIQQLEEECCDAWVVLTLPDAVRSYARTLLETVNFLADARPALPPVASGFGYVSLLKRRLNMILSQPPSPRLSWPALLGALLFGALVLPAAPQRATAQSADDEVIVQTADEPSEAQPSPRSADTRDLDRRLRALERKMDRVIQALEKSQAAPAGATPKPSDGQKEELRGRAEMEQARQHLRTMLEMQKRRAEESRRFAEDARRRVKEGRSEDDEPKDKVKEKAGKALTSEQARDLERQLQQAISQAINPERLKEMEKRIEKTVGQSMDPKRLESMGKEIEAAVNRAIDPKRLEAMSRQIEQAVNRAVQQDQGAKQQTEVRERQRTEQRERTRTMRGAGAGSGAGGSARPESTGRGDLERRMDRLEERMDRLIQALETSRKPSTR